MDIQSYKSYKNLPKAERAKVDRLIAAYAKDPDPCWWLIMERFGIARDQAKILCGVKDV